MGFQFCKQIFYVISIIVIRVISFLGPIWSRKHKEPIDAYMYSLTDMYSLWAQIIGKDLPTPLFCFLAASENLRALVDRPLTAESNKTDELDQIPTTEK